MTRPRIGAAILAAGASRRLGQPKQLLPVGGTTLVRAIATELCAASCDRVAVVVGADGDRVANALDGLAVARLENLCWQEGMASSIRCAALWADARCDALVLVTCDQPALRRDHIDRLISAYLEGDGEPVGSRYAGVVGVPAIFGAWDFVKLRLLGGDTGARSLLGTAAVDWPEGAVDLDTSADFHAYRATMFE